MIVGLLDRIGDTVDRDLAPVARVGGYKRLLSFSPGLGLFAPFFSLPPLPFSLPHRFVSVLHPSIQPN